MAVLVEGFWPRRRARLAWVSGHIVGRALPMGRAPSGPHRIGIDRLVFADAGPLNPGSSGCLIPPGCHFADSTAPGRAVRRENLQKSGPETGIEIQIQYDPPLQRKGDSHYE